MRTFADRNKQSIQMTIENEAFARLSSSGIRPSLQRLAIMEYLLAHHIHPTVEDVYNGLSGKISTLSRTTVYNTLRMFSEHHVAQMITIDDHHVCYDGELHPHVHFFCRQCGKVFDMMEEKAPVLSAPIEIEGHRVEEQQLYYKGVCRNCKNSSIH